MLTKVELPLALKTIMAGVNQATMMAVAMVVIAALIGAEGLGNEVLFAMGRVRVGQGIEAGLAILILVVILDRLTQAFGDKGEQTHGE
jgi:glycine betaine/proline transport system permease protein